MSFETLTEEQLTKIADDFVVDLDGAEGVDAIAAKIAGELSFDDVIAEFPEYAPEEPEEEEVVEKPVAKKAAAKKTKEEPKVLIKMTRANGTFEVRNYKFTQDHPYVLVNEDDADFICDNYRGFKLATPKEAREFYS